jgi:hypothetical protein
MNEVSYNFRCTIYGDRVARMRCAEFIEANVEGVSRPDWQTQ